jgi:transposase
VPNEVVMPRPYLTDRRERVLTAGERREGSREEVARRFRATVSTLYL